MGAASSVRDRRYDYTSTSFSEEGEGVGGFAALEKALSFVKGEESAEIRKRRKSRAKVDFIAKPQHTYHPSKDYKFEKILGEGAFSKVFRAYKLNRPASGNSKNKENAGVEGNPSSRVVVEAPSSSSRFSNVAEKVAVKEVHLKHLSKHQVQNMEREVQILSQLDHPDVVKMHAVYRIPNQMFIVLEYLRGGELLKAICQRKRYTEDDARALLRPILEGVRYLHSRDVIHRDIKPENLILSDKSLGSQIKIVDFGFACLVDRSDEAGFFRRHSFSSGSGKSSSDKNSSYLCGTPGYLAPEVIECKQYGTACDMWSVGVVVYILLSGTMPFSIKSYKHVLTGNFQFPDDRWATVSPGAKDLIRRLLTVDPEMRFTADQALKHDWLRAVGVVGVENSTSGVLTSGSTVTPEIAVDARVARSLTSSDSASKLPGVGSGSGSNLEVRKRKSGQSLEGVVCSPRLIRSIASKEGLAVSNGSGTASGLATSSSGVKKERSHDSISASGSAGPPLVPVVGDLTGNIPSIRNFTAMRKFYRSLNVVTAMVKFRDAGLQRERRRSRSESQGSSGSSEQDSIMEVGSTPTSEKALVVADSGMMMMNEKEKMDKEEEEGLTELTPRPDVEVPAVMDSSAVGLDSEFTEECGSSLETPTGRFVD